MIVDDEDYSVSILEQMVRKTPYLQLVYCTTNPVAALAQIGVQPVQLVFLDMHMGELNGIEFMKAATGTPLYVLCTAHSNYAVESYEYDVVDYLLKPILYPRFLAAVQKAKDKLEHRQVKKKEEEPVLFIRTVNKSAHVKIKILDITHIESKKNYVCIHVGGERLLARFTMKEIAAKLPGGHFIRVHASFIVAVKKVKACEQNNIHLSGVAVAIPLSNTYRKEVYDALKISR